MSVITELPTVNFDSYPGYDEFKYLHKVYSEEFKMRSTISSQWGIVDTGYDPATAPFTSGRSLLVTTSPINPLTIDIASGMAITPSRLLINIDSIVPSINLPLIAAGKIYVVAVEYVLVASEQQRINRFGDLTEVRLERPSNIPIGGGTSTLTHAITVSDINDYNNTGIFSEERKQNLVVIAIVNVLSDPTTSELYLSIDLTRNSYSFNRPWFTVIDVDHRTKIGSGLITENNPHGLDLQDLSSAGLTLYQQLKPRGGVFAKDTSYYGYAGKICTEEIILSRWETDLTGETTQTGMGGRYFCRLTKLPVRVGSLYLVGKPWEPIPYTWNAGTRIIVLGALENPKDYETNLIIEYFTVDALEINSESPNQGLQFIEIKEPIEGEEFIVSGGLALNALTQTSLSLPSLLGSIKRGYHLVCDRRGMLILNPQPILTNIRVLDLVGTTQTINQAPLNGSAVHVTVGLTRAVERTIINPTTSYDLDLKVQVIGVDGNGTQRTEVLNFKGSQWKDQATVNEEQPLQFLRTQYKYQLINSVALTNTTSTPHNAGPDALISIWADALSGSANQELASIASFFWTGTTAIRVKDERFITTSLNKLDQKQYRYATESPDESLSCVQELLSLILSPPLTDPAESCRRLMLEMDDDRVWSETWNEFSTTAASGAITVNDDMNYVTIGQTIRIAQGKYLKIVESGGSASIGEVNYNASLDIVKNNIIATINDPTWDSTWFASLGSGSNPPIMLTRENAYPEGFILNRRQRLYFPESFSMGKSLTLDINGESISQAFDTDNDTTLTLLEEQINNISDITGVTAFLEDSTSPYTIVLNGNGDGIDFEVTISDIVGFLTTPYLLPISTEAFNLTSPSGGKLPILHLPRRYPNALSPWVYLSRPYLWEGVILEATISINSNDVTNIGNFDSIEIAPSKIIIARAGTGATADPTIGQFLVDLSSLENTLNNIASTINHPAFKSGIHAHVNNNSVVLQSSGMALTTLRLIAEAITGAWVLTELDGITRYLPKGSGSSHAFIKTLRPCDVAEWRFVTVEDIDLGWSPWMPLASLNPTVFMLAAPMGESLYQIQFKLQSKEINAFSLYQYYIETASYDLISLGNRLTPLESEVIDARGSTSSLNDRLIQIIEDDGTPIQDSELLSSRKSVITSDTSTLKEHLDSIDTKLYYASFGGMTPHGVTSLGYGFPPQLISGPTMDGNSRFITESNPKITVSGNLSYPLIAQINGYTYKYTRDVEIDFTGQPADLYYIYLEEETPYGRELISGTITATEDAMSITDLSANFTASGVQSGHLLYFDTITVSGNPLVIPIDSIVSATQLNLKGRIPQDLFAVTYKIYNPREGTISFHSGDKILSTNRLYLGEATWTGSNLSAINYRYLNKYTSPMSYVDAALGSYTLSFTHNLGFIPSQFILYYYETPISDPKILQIGDEAVVKTNKYTMTIRNRYTNLVARTYTGTAKADGYLQLVI